MSKPAKGLSIIYGHLHMRYSESHAKKTYNVPSSMAHYPNTLLCMQGMCHTGQCLVILIFMQLSFLYVPLLKFHSNFCVHVLTCQCMSTYIHTCTYSVCFRTSSLLCINQTCLIYTVHNKSILVIMLALGLFS